MICCTPNDQQVKPFNPGSVAVKPPPRRSGIESPPGHRSSRAQAEDAAVLVDAS